VDGVIFPELLLHNTSEDSMRKLYRKLSKRCSIVRCVAISLIGLALAGPALAQANSPWENAVNVLQQAFTSTIARGLSLVAIVVSGLTFAFGEGGSKRVLAGVLFGVGMAIAAVNFLAWLFPG
jgi:type IV secretion system protein TrbC